MKAISSIEVYNYNGSQLTAQGESNLYTALSVSPSITRRLGREAEMQLDVIPGHAWERVLASRQKLKVIYDDDSFEEWRIKRVVSNTHGGGTTVSAVSIWTDLADTIMKRVVAPGGEVLFGVTLMSLTAEEALEEILSDTWNAPSLYKAGTVAEAFTDETPVVEGVGITHLEAIHQICQQIGAEWELRWDGDESVYRIDIVEEVGGGTSTLRPIDAPTGGAVASKGNRASLQITDDGDQYFNAIIPLCGQREHPTTIAKARWTIESISLQGAADYVLTLKEEPGPIPENDFLIGLKIGNDNAGYYEIIDSQKPNKVTITGDVSLMEDDVVRFVDSDENDLVTLPLNHGDTAVERTEFFENIPPETNLAREAGISVDMSEGDSLPTGTSLIGSATAEFATAAPWVNIGKKAVKVTADTDDGIETISIPVGVTDKEPNVSALARIQVESGRVAMEIVDSDDAVYPPKSAAQSNKNAPTDLSVGGVEVVGPIKVRLRALEDGTVFYWDAVTVTRSDQPVRYSDRMGPRWLFWVGANRLIKSGGAASIAYDSEFIDAAAFDSGSEEIRLGDRVQVRDRHIDGQWRTAFTARVVELREDEDTAGRIRKRVRLSRERSTIADRFVQAPPVPEAESVPSNEYTIAVSALDKSFASIELLANANEASINSHTSILGTNGLTGSTNITQRVTTAEGSINDMLAEVVIKAQVENGEITKLAALEMGAGIETGSNIDLIADVVAVRTGDSSVVFNEDGITIDMPIEYASKYAIDWVGGGSTISVYGQSTGPGSSMFVVSGCDLMMLDGPLLIQDNDGLHSVWHKGEFKDATEGQVLTFDGEQFAFADPVGGGGQADSVEWDDVLNKPSTFTPSSHTHLWSQITSGVPDFATRWPAWDEVTSKPSTFTPSTHNHDGRYYTETEVDTLLGDKADSSTLSAHTADTSNPHEVTKSQVGLGSVQNYAVATQAQAEAGDLNTRYMTPLRTKQAIEELALTSLPSHDHTGDTLKPAKVECSGDVLYNFSDVRLKENLVPLEGSLDRLSALRTVSFSWIEGAPNGMGGLPDVGLIAQDVAEVFPEAAREKEGFLTILERALTPHIVAAIRELRDRVEALEARNGQ